MITIYKDRKDIPHGKDYVELNDVYFNRNTSFLVDFTFTNNITILTGASGTGLTKTNI